MLILGLVFAIIGVLTGWLAPEVAKSRRPYGVNGDIAAAVATMLVLGFVYYLWLVPWFEDRWDMPAWLSWLAIIGEPWIVSLIVLWLMRKAGPAAPDDVEPGVKDE